MICSKSCTLVQKSEGVVISLDLKVGKRQYIETLICFYLVTMSKTVIIN